MSFSGFAIAAGVVGAALLLPWVPPRLRLPVLGLAIVLVIALRLPGLGWVMTDLPIKALAATVLVVVLVLAGPETGIETRGDTAHGNIVGNELLFFGLSLVIVLGVYVLLATVIVRAI